MFGLRNRIFLRFPQSIRFCSAAITSFWTFFAKLGGGACLKQLENREAIVLLPKIKDTKTNVNVCVQDFQPTERKKKMYNVVNIKFSPMKWKNEFSRKEREKIEQFVRFFRENRNIGSRKKGEPTYQLKIVEKNTKTDRNRNPKHNPSKSIDITAIWKTYVRFWLYFLYFL